MKIIVGTRGSKLAVTQTNWVINKLKEKHPEVEFETKIILKYMDKVNLSDYIEIDDYFLDNVIPYKVGDIK